MPPWLLLMTNVWWGVVQSILEACEADLQAVVDRDPACEKFAQALLYFKGFQAIQCHRLNNWLWRNNRRVRRLNMVLWVHDYH